SDVTDHGRRQDSTGALKRVCRRSAMMPDASVRRSSAIQTDQLSNRTYETLRDRILQGDLSSGQRLAVRELAESLGVSVAPVRDAVNRLAADGLVEVSPRRGTVVASFT